MKLHEFFREYANVPLPERHQEITVGQLQGVNLNAIYEKLKKLSDKIRPMEIEIEEWLSIAEKHLPKKTNK